MQIGFIGLGIMGMPMAKNLLRAGHTLTVFNRSYAKMQALAESCGARLADSPAAVAAQSDYVITMLPNSPDVREVVLGENGVLAGARPGMILIDMSSIAPLTSREVAEALQAKGVEMLDAPVSGGEPKAIDGTLSIMVGGKPEVFEKCREIFSVLGSSAVLCGEIGAGNTTKLANQIIVAGNIAAMSEALVLGTKAGVDPEVLYRAIRGGLAGSTVLDAKVPMILERDFTPGFKIDLHIKDLKNVLETAEDLGVPLTVAPEVMKMMQALREDGLGQADHSGVVQYYEKQAGIIVRQK